jgi:sarcosine oxidase delta subunit
MSAQEFMEEVVMSEVVAGMQSGGRVLKGEKRSRIRKRLPFVAYLVQEMRGDHGQMSLCEANELKLQRHVRDSCKEKNVRSVDIAALWPLVHAAYFYSRDDTQALAEEWKHTSSFVNSYSETTHVFCGSAGRSSVARST